MHCNCNLQRMRALMHRMHARAILTRLRLTGFACLKVCRSYSEHAAKCDMYLACIFFETANASPTPSVG